jgi:phosphatidylglycerol:prolipoprotein diacylglycerol transferase
MALSAMGGGWLSLSYIVLNIDPILLRIGSIAVHWYGLAYVVAISVGLWVIFRWAHTKGIAESQIWPVFLWAAAGGLIGGRLYFVIQQPNLVNNYLLDPINIIAVWNGGMAFFGAVFLGALTVFLVAPRYGLSRFIVLDGGAVFAMVGQIFGRFGNIINGDILGYAVANHVNVPANVCAQAPCVSYVSDPHILPWAIVYLNPNSFAPQGIPFQPAPIYEMLMNLVILGLLWPFRLSLPKVRAGLLFTAYFALYGLTQVIVFFFRGTEPITPFLGIDVLKQAQWTGIFVMLAAIPLFFAVRRFSAPWPYDEEHPQPWVEEESEQETESKPDAEASTRTPVLAGAGAGKNGAKTSITKAAGKATGATNSIGANAQQTSIRSPVTSGATKRPGTTTASTASTNTINSDVSGRRKRKGTKRRR